MSVPLARLSQVLACYSGEVHAVSAATLARLVGLPPDGRTLRHAVNALIDAGVPIGSTTRGGGGYFLIETDGELAACVAQYESRREELAHRIAQLREAFAHGPRQGSLVG